MGDLIPFFKEEELIGQGSLEMKFQDKHLVQYLTFAKHRLRRAITICQKDIAAGIFCVLTESDTHFSIWRERPAVRQKEPMDATPNLQPQLNESQLSRPKEKEISSPIEAIEFVYAASPAVTGVNPLATVGQTLETPVEVIEKKSQSEIFPHQPAVAAAPTKTSKSPTKTAKIYSTPRSAFLALLNQELAKFIPKADYLINKLLAEQPNIPPQQMIEAIIAEIPDPKESQNIQKSLERLIHKLTVK